jgi:hypothetical protein
VLLAGAIALGTNFARIVEMAPALRCRARIPPDGAFALRLYGPPGRRRSRGGSPQAVRFGGRRMGSGAMNPTAWCRGPIRSGRRRPSGNEKELISELFMSISGYVFYSPLQWKRELIVSPPEQERAIIKSTDRQAD